MRWHPDILFKIALVSLIISGCHTTIQQSSFASEPSSNSTTSPPQNTVNLPNALYYLSSIGSGNVQIWRLSPDETELSLLTSIPGEAVGILDFDVSFITNQLAYIAGNQLLLSDIDAGVPRMLLDANQINGTNDNIPQTIQTIHWSPDGSTLAFSLGGINLYNLNSGSIVNILPDVLVDEGNTSILGTTYNTLAWSPDGSRLLISINRPGATNLGILSISTGILTELNPGPVCCQAIWTPDSQEIIAANPYLGAGKTGLWTYNVETGSGRELITSQANDNTYNLVGWPILTQEGWLQYFFANLPDFPDAESAFILVRSNRDGVSDRTPLRTDSFFPKEVLWSLDGKIAIMVINSPGSSTWSPMGPIILIQQSNSIVQPLAADGYNLHWGP
jgi:WD40-like Beta Propeller Repeat